ncbi:MAG: hypothetical protein WEE89_22545 [Gemmatimonadota bacterium]
MTIIKKFFRPTLPLVLITIAAGCQDTSGPGSLSKLNAAAALADYNAMDAVLQSTGWKSFQMTAAKMDVTKFGFAPAAAARATAALSELAPGGDPRAFASAMASVANETVVAAAARIPLISDANRGKTFVFSAQLHDWVVDPARTGAPANGVRFITYEPKGAEPDPTRPTGHADLIDLGNASAGIALRLVVVEGSLTVLDYKTTLEGTDAGGHVTVDGFIQNNRDKLDFDIDVSGEKSGGAEQGEISLDLGIAAREFRVTGEVRSEKQNGSESGSVDLSVRHGAASFRVDIENDLGTLSGTIDLNNAAFAKVSGEAQQPVFKNPSGGDINGAEALVLWRIFDITEDVFDLFEDLVEPIAELVIIAVIL